jgi:hypothetical protein
MLFLWPNDRTSKTIAHLAVEKNDGEVLVFLHEFCSDRILYDVIQLDWQVNAVSERPLTKPNTQKEYLRIDRTEFILRSATDQDFQHLDQEKKQKPSPLIKIVDNHRNSTKKYQIIEHQIIEQVRFRVHISSTIMENQDYELVQYRNPEGESGDMDCIDDIKEPTEKVNVRDGYLTFKSTQIKPGMGYCLQIKTEMYTPEAVFAFVCPTLFFSLPSWLCTGDSVRATNSATSSTVPSILNQLCWDESV